MNISRLELLRAENIRKLGQFDVLDAKYPNAVNTDEEQISHYHYLPPPPLLFLP